MVKEEAVATHSHVHLDNKWPSWQSNSSQSLNIFLIPKILKCVIMHFSTLHLKTTTFWLNIKIIKKKKYVFTVE